MLQITSGGGVAKPGQPRRTQDYTIKMGDPVPKGFVGSNPTPSTATTVRIPNIRNTHLGLSVFEFFHFRS